MGISIYPDFTQAVQEARKKFNPAKQQLRDLKIEYAMLYPARLKVTEDGKTKIYNDPKELLKYLRTKKP